MLIGSFNAQYISSLNGDKNALVSGGFHVRVTTMGDTHYSNPTIHTEEHHLNKYRVRLGSFISIASGCKFLLSGNHDWMRTTTYLNPYIDRDSEGILSNGDIIIGNDVWIGMDCTIMSGVTIGTGSVIAAGSVVTRDIAPYSIVGGIPSKLIRKRFDTDTIDRLLKSEWWNLDESELKKHSNLLFSRDVEQFLDIIENKLK